MLIAQNFCCNAFDGVSCILGKYQTGWSRRQASWRIIQKVCKEVEWEQTSKSKLHSD